MEIVNYRGWPNCVRLSNASLELIITTDVGPRVIRCGAPGGPNLFKEFDEQIGQTGGDQWKSYGGHRFWHAPEDKPRTYQPDNGPVHYEYANGALHLKQAKEPETDIVKEIDVTLDPDCPHARLVHRLINVGLWDVELAPWALSVMAPGGRAVLPQEPFVPWPQGLLPARPLVLWPYANMSDPRYTWGQKFVQLRQDAKAESFQKIGIRNGIGWGAYTLGGYTFLKKTVLMPEANYPDFGCNWETFTNPKMLELETLGPMTRLAAKGGSVEHVEDWYFFADELPEKEDALEKKIGELLAKTV